MIFGRAAGVKTPSRRNLRGRRDVAPEARHDVVPKARPDTVPKAGPDTVPKARPDTVPKAGPDTVPKAGADTVPKAGPDIAPKAPRDVASAGPAAAAAPYAGRSAATPGGSMLRTLLSRLALPEQPEPLPGEEARLALAALMVRAARADESYDARERAEILNVLAERHGLDPAGAESLLQEAEATEAEAPDTVRFTRALKQAVPYEDRAEVMRMLWRVALADGRRDPAEDALLRQLAPLLGVQDQDSAIARQQAARD